MTDLTVRTLDAASKIISPDSVAALRGKLRRKNRKFCQSRIGFVAFGCRIKFLTGIPDGGSRIDYRRWSENRLQLFNLGGKTCWRGFEEHVHLGLHGFEEANLQSGVRELGTLNGEEQTLRIADVARETTDRTGVLG